MVRCSLIAAMAMALSAAAKTVTYDWNVTWVTANPDGATERKIVGINGAWPLPVVEVDKGDRLIVNMYNGLGDKSTSIHWHGMFQNGTSHMDGPSMVTQCPVPPGSSMTYNFTVDQNGTYWYHCHTDYCYPDGYRQALIVNDKDAPFMDKFDKEYIFTMSDWYHDLFEDLSSQFMSLYNPSGAEPVPNSFLINDQQKTTFDVEPGKTYLFRLINIGAFTGMYFYIEGYNFTIVEVDGVYTEPQVASQLYLSVAQRYTILVTMSNDTTVNPAIVTICDKELFDTFGPELQLNQSSWLVVNKSAPLIDGQIIVDDCTDLEPYDDISLVPTDGGALFENPTKQISVTVYMVNLMTGYNYAMFDNITYTMPKVPSLYTAVSAPEDQVSNDVIYGEYTHPFVLEHNEVVEVIVNNGDSGTHPFHLHGHNFQVIDRAPPYGADFYEYRDLPEPVFYDPENHTDFPTMPIRRDVVVLPSQGYMVLRFVADNPGVWIFHCHIDWHLSSGLAMIFVEAPDVLKKSLSIPDDHLAACNAGSVPFAGNAAANSENFLDLSGQPKQPKRIPQGWTPRGETAMAFSVLSAVLGIAALTVYGLADIKNRKQLTPIQHTSPTGESASDEVVAKQG